MYEIECNFLENKDLFSSLPLYVVIINQCFCKQNEYNLNQEDTLFDTVMKKNRQR